MTQPVVVLTRKWPDRVESEMARLFDLRAVAGGQPLEPDEIIARCRGASILCPTFADRVPASLIDRLPATIRLIASYGVGTNHMDIAAAMARNILVSNTPDVVTTDTADLTMGLIVAVSRRIAEGDSQVRAGRWKGVGLFNMLGSRVSGKTLGIIGMGRIGTAVARRARGFGMAVLYHGRRRNREAEAELGVIFRGALDDLLRDADIVSLHCPLTSETRHIIDRRALTLMGPEAFVINTGRGALIDETALVGALGDGVIGGAGLDVFEFEPELAAGLSELPNTVLLPHVGTATREAREEMGWRVIANIESYVRTGVAPDNVTG